MSEQEEIKLYDRIRESISSAQRRMLERKSKLGEPVVVADTNGKPMEISADEALRLFEKSGRRS